MFQDSQDRDPDHDVDLESPGWAFQKTMGENPASKKMRKPQKSNKLSLLFCRKKTTQNVLGTFLRLPNLGPHHDNVASFSLPKGHHSGF